VIGTTSSLAQDPNAVISMLHAAACSNCQHSSSVIPKKNFKGLFKKEKKKLTQAEHTACRAGMLRRLKKLCHEVSVVPWLKTCASYPQSFYSGTSRERKLKTKVHLERCPLNA